MPHGDDEERVDDDPATAAGARGAGVTTTGTEAGASGAKAGTPGAKAGASGDPVADGGVEAAYVFRVTVRLDPDVAGVWAEPDTFETTVFRAADPPGESGWLYFRDNLWRGDVGDEQYMREVVEEALGTAVDDVAFSELRTTEAYLEDLRAAVADDLDLFNAATVDEAVSKYLGSSIRVTDDP